MQWESGRTRRTLLQVISESKAKMQSTSGGSLSAFFPNTAWNRKRPPEQLPAAYILSLPTLDNLRNFL
jgi:hypothetical protein